MSFYTYSKHQIVWTTSQASMDTTSNSLEQFQLVDSMFQLFAPVLYRFLGLKYKHVGLKVIFFIGSIKLLDVPRYQIFWTTRSSNLYLNSSNLYLNSSNLYLNLSNLYLNIYLSHMYVNIKMRSATATYPKRLLRK